jgi:hypothetical protein
MTPFETLTSFFLTQLKKENPRKANRGDLPARTSVFWRERAIFLNNSGTGNGIYI